MKKAIAIMALATLLPATATANSPDFNIKADHNLKNVTMTITGPDGFKQTARSLSGMPSTSMSKNGAPLTDGTYTWEMTGNTGKRIVTAKNLMDNGRGDAQRPYSYETVTYSGTFEVKNGVRVENSLSEK